MKMWIARDYDGALWLYDRKPIIDDLGCMFVNDGADICKASELHGDLFPEVTFENSPMEVELKLIEK